MSHVRRKAVIPSVDEGRSDVRPLRWFLLCGDVRFLSPRVKCSPGRSRFSRRQQSFRSIQTVALTILRPTAEEAPAATLPQQLSNVAWSAELAVNMAGSMVSFLLATFQARI